MSSLPFMKQYVSKPKTVGAVLPSSKYLADRIIKYINFDYACYIVEYGPGTGVFTDRMLRERKQDTIILLFECNAEFYKILKQKYKDEQNFYIVNDSAEHIGKYLATYGIPYVDYIVSGLPFASLPRDVSSSILAQTRKYLKEGGRFITFQYTLTMKSFIGQFFNEIGIEREVRNFPPAYVFCCSEAFALAPSILQKQWVDKK